ncbi:cupredoxin family copper-binding protein [Mycobacterium sp. OTB74]|uniref:cupredoxin domain-containing protein n=1 Tax=Mycobacterium sp. OTB74 TaxID=1853452 RepID=UPI0024738153|nr:cupredoxin family copper-binding protein [Mycobacterium sp. OTB74]MDH6242856.1 plastocyanin [Mycobacterium sp. OTB74]
MSRRSLAVLSFAAVLLAACSSQTPQSSTATPVFNQPPGATPGLQGTGSAPAMGSMSMPTTEPRNPEPAGPNSVNIDNFAFAPATLTVAVGTTVTWTNHDEDPHNIVAEGGQFRSPAMGSGATFSYLFSEPGTFGYVCGIHPFMHGTVVVTR